ncbi:hypothetical protein FRB97_000150 [Tulasnella sp. 331]|nr:hypothetical protein FRB98_002809 [Tulasnella sp. 332]KAG8885707.1 hypothetical protein FRB97_000150 [Tulasnella sp. 331]
MPTVIVWIVRHGETYENAAGIIQGQRDTILNDQGRAQSKAAADALAYVPFSVAYTSELKRASDTAQILLRKHHRNVTLYSDPLLKERFMGSWEGTRGVSLKDKDKAEKRPPWDGEPSPVFGARCLAWWDSSILPLAKASTNPNISRNSEVHVLAVTHGAYIQTLLYNLVAARSYRGKELLGPSFYNTSISAITVEPGGRSGEILYVANIQHLIQPGLTDNPDVLEGEDKAGKEMEADAPREL